MPRRLTCGTQPAGNESRPTSGVPRSSLRRQARKSTFRSRGSPRSHLVRVRRLSLCLPSRSQSIQPTGQSRFLCLRSRRTFHVYYIGVVLCALVTERRDPVQGSLRGRPFVNRCADAMAQPLKCISKMMARGRNESADMTEPSWCAAGLSGQPDQPQGASPRFPKNRTLARPG